ncbi:uncharacterized protein LY89DRAFT_672104 [Mollisia scopiformis]|uniref:Uncharacterized protein n=1 Tax=Mollisia scopiformis TaxID=149040 RepID=A0A194X0U9_MOLSC|nr:uncharacterized protein LY89DRAFT_672104 [Mollisia scopiformis]KUJ13823.1 hypothetical protein LY89DRAFT_672104 [Mollisia scopiformis]
MSDLKRKRAASEPADDVSEPVTLSKRARSVEPEMMVFHQVKSSPPAKEASPAKSSSSAEQSRGTKRKHVTPPSSPPPVKPANQDLPDWWVSGSDDEDEEESDSEYERPAKKKARKTAPEKRPEWFLHDDEENEWEEELRTSEGESEDEDDEVEGQVSLYDRLAGNKQLAQRGDDYGEEGSEDDDSEGGGNAHDFYGEDPDAKYSMEEAYKRKIERDDPSYDSDFVAEEVSSGGKINMPDYKSMEKKDKAPEVITKAEDEEKKAWKALNAHVAEQVVPDASEEYVEWNANCKEFFAAETIKDLFDEEVSFPVIKAEVCGHTRDCVRGEKLGICHHDVLRVLRGSGVHVEGEQWIERLKRERLRWHPDKFVRKMGTEFKDEAKEMFQMVQVILEKAEQ